MAFRNNAKLGFVGFTLPAPQEYKTPFEKAKWQIEEAVKKDGYVIDKRKDTSTSARIILGSVDNFHTEKRGGRPEYCMDFLYDDDLDVKGFLLRDKESVEKWEDFGEALEHLP